jgi:hypothetical protein
MNKQTAISIGIIVVVIVAALILLQRASDKPGKLDTFAACLGDQGATFFGAFWCPHCAQQKAMFGSSVEFLPYKECSTPDSKGQTQICIDAGIQSYPTWQFADGSRVTGVQELSTLAEKTGCPLPDDTNSTPVDGGIGESSTVSPDETPVTQ